MYSFCEAQDIEIDTLIHEAGAAQMEINLLHGYPMSLADQAFLFKRTAREAAHAPQDVRDVHGEADGEGARQRDAPAPEHRRREDPQEHLQQCRRHAVVAVLRPHRRTAEIPAGAMSLFAPNVNSYRRISRYSSAPINVHWGYDNRTAGLRVPMSGPEARRVENRVGGADANPYLAIAASLACGYLGMVEGLKPSEPIAGSAYDLAIALPRTLAESLRLLRESKPLVDVFGDRFVLAYTAVKEAEYETFAQVISSWEREHLLLNV